MTDTTSTLERATRLTAFATLGTLGTTQDLIRAALATLSDVPPDLEMVAEETLCLTAVATARAAELGLRADFEVAETVLPVLLDLPFTYRDYLVGGAVVTQQDTRLLDANEDVYRRLHRKHEFYAIHLPPGQFPGERALHDKLGLWMGRISPPGLPTMPAERLKETAAEATLLTHLKLVLAFARRGSLSA